MDDNLDYKIKVLNQLVDEQKRMRDVFIEALEFLWTKIKETKTKE